MSVHYIAKVWALEIPSTPKLVLLSLADQANDKGICWPSQPYIARRCSLSDRAVRVQLTFLEEAKVIRRNVRAGVGTTFTLTLPDADEPRHDVPPRNNMPPRHDVPATPEQYAGNPGMSCRQNVSNRQQPSTEGDKHLVSSKAADLCPHQAIVDLYHEALPNNPRCKVLSTARKAAIKARWNEAAKLSCKPFGYTTRDDGLSAWRAFFEICADSDFLTGKVPGTNGRPSFVAGIDFLMSASGFAKTLENNYHREAAA